MLAKSGRGAKLGGRAQGWKLVYSCARDLKPFVELYDRHECPLEVTNHAGDPARANVLDDMKHRLAAQLHDVGYPYADVVEDRMAKARARMPAPDELVLPRVVSLKPSQDGNGRLVAEFTIEWNVGEPLAAASEAGSKYWTFVQVLGAGARTIVARATLWPDPPTTAWKPATKQTVGPLRVPILPNMQGSYPVRVGLYCPETKSHPLVAGDAQRIVGTLTVDNDTGGGQTLSFRAQN